MTVHELDVRSTGLIPSKAEPTLIIDANVNLALAIPFQNLKPKGQSVGPT